MSETAKHTAGEWAPRKADWRVCALDDETLTAAFHAHKDGQPKFTRRMAINLADMAEMRPMSMVWRLEKMGLIKRGSWEWFKANGGITKEHEAEVRADRAAAKATPVQPARGE